MRLSAPLRMAGRALAVSAAVSLIVGILGPAARAQVPAGVEETTGIQFRTVDGLDLFMDAYLPSGGRDLPAIIGIHGGGFSRGFRSDFKPACLWLAQSGYACFTVDYRLAPNFDPVPPGKQLPERPRMNGPGYPAQVEDVKAAIEFVRQNADRFGVDPKRMGTLGESAGATLSLMIGAESQTSHSEGWEVAGAASWSAGVAFSVLAQQVLGQELEPESNHSLPTFVFGEKDVNVEGSEDGDPAVEDLTEIQRADPYTHLSPNSAPILVANGSNELVPAVMPETFAQRLEQLEIPHELVILPGSDHAQGLGPEVKPPTLEFFDEHVRGFEGFEPSDRTAPPPEEPPVTGDGRGGGRRAPVLPILLVIAGLVLVAMLIGRGRRRQAFRRRPVPRR